MQEKIEEAAARFEEAARVKADFAPAYYNLGLARERQGRDDDAIAAYARARRPRVAKRRWSVQLGACAHAAGPSRRSRGAAHQSASMETRLPGRGRCPRRPEGRQATASTRPAEIA